MFVTRKIQRQTLAITMVCWCFLAKATVPADSIPANGIYLTAEDFMHRKLALPFEKKDKPSIRFRTPLGHAKELWLKSGDSLYKFFDDEIWGYRQDETDRRIYNSRDYFVHYTGKIIIYSVPTGPADGSTETNYFSLNLYSPVYELSKKNLKLVYHDNITFVRRLDKLKWTQSIFERDRKTGHYCFIDWL